MNDTPSVWQYFPLQVRETLAEYSRALEKAQDERKRLQAKKKELQSRVDADAQREAREAAAEAARMLGADEAEVALSIPAVTSPGRSLRLALEECDRRIASAEVAEEEIRTTARGYLLGQLGQVQQLAYRELQVEHVRAVEQRLAVISGINELFAEHDRESMLNLMALSQFRVPHLEQLGQLPKERQGRTVPSLSCDEFVVTSAKQVRQELTAELVEHLGDWWKKPPAPRASPRRR
jgi:hypothetical protein